ncbi:MAG: flagellar M-ring protein FliF [Blastocatellia bacterium]|nr:flagellar M-ring protein FliF [Blastocatellia bacterium]
MPEFFSQWIALWNRLTLRQRMAVGGAVAGTLVLMGTLVYFGSQTEYGVLFSDLKNTDAQAIIEQLKASNVPYQLSGGGSVISVPSERVSELRLQMASSTLTGGHVGFDIFDRGNFGATDFSQKVSYQRALEGELARTLEGLDEVETARVHITPQRESVFAEKKEKGKASVVLRMRQSRELSRERTDAIVNLVASSTEGLDPSDVTVMDNRGRLLSAPGRNTGATGGANVFNSHLETRQKLETETASRIVALLEPVVGKGHVQADVAAEVDFSQIEQTEEKYDPQSAVIRSQQSSAEYRTPGPIISGVVGARGNDPNNRVPPPTPTPTPTPPPVNGQGQAVPQPTPAMPAQVAPDQRNASTLNYEIDKTVRRTIGGLGRVTRLSASVLVDHKAVNGASVARAPEELKRIQDLVAAAIGVDPKRGDQVVVESFPFNKTDDEAAKPTWLDRYRDMVLTGIKYGSLVLAALLLIFFVVRPAQKALTSSTESEPKLLAAVETPETAGTAATAETLREAIPAERRENQLEAPPSESATVAQLLSDTTPRTVAELEAEMNSPQESELNPNSGVTASGATPVDLSSPMVVRERLTERSRQEPELVAMTLRTWLHETRS